MNLSLRILQKEIFIHFYEMRLLNGTISEGESEVVELLRNNKNITVKELAEVSGKSIRTINRIMSLLKSKRLIERIESNKNGYWKVK